MCCAQPLRTAPLPTQSAKNSGRYQILDANTGFHHTWQRKYDLLGYVMTKKMLVPVVDDKKNWRDERGWFVPLWTKEGIRCIAVPGSKPRQFGLVVYTGKEISASDLIEVMHKNGADISCMAQQRSLLEEFLELVSRFRIGDIVCGVDDNGKLRLEKKTSLVATVQKSRLP